MVPMACRAHSEPESTVHQMCNWPWTLLALTYCRSGIWMFLTRCKLTVAAWTRKNLAGYLSSPMVHIDKTEFSNTNRKKYMITFIIACVLFVVAIVAIASLFFESTVAGLATAVIATIVG